MPDEVALDQKIAKRIEALRSELDALKVNVPREIAIFEARMNERAAMIQREIDELQAILA